MLVKYVRVEFPLGFQAFHEFPHMVRIAKTLGRIGMGIVLELRAGHLPQRGNFALLPGFVVHAATLVRRPRQNPSAVDFHAGDVHRRLIGRRRKFSLAMLRCRRFTLIEQFLADRQRQPRDLRRSDLQARLLSHHAGHRFNSSVFAFAAAIDPISRSSWNFHRTDPSARPGK